MPNRGEIWLADLDPRRGTEPGKTRPVLIIQSQALLDASHPSTVIIPLTTNVIDDVEPLRIRIPASGRMRRDSDLLIDQFRAIDNRRLVQGPIAHLSNALMTKVAEAVGEILNLTES
ncbi:MAG: type II toxin-antitoxin system PemK/MazF family toxin [Candidatus Methylomirabilis oxyfera]|nr:type II toxin-antitoxin system PemK/MazF family toxin [Candidatus Methylomirabilis oxyfera]